MSYRALIRLKRKIILWTILSQKGRLIVVIQAERSTETSATKIRNSKIASFYYSLSVALSCSYDVLANSANFDPIFKNFVAKMVRIQPEIQKCDLGIRKTSLDKRFKHVSSSIRAKGAEIESFKDLPSKKSLEKE